MPPVLQFFRIVASGLQLVFLLLRATLLLHGDGQVGIEIVRLLREVHRRAGLDSDALGQRELELQGKAEAKIHVTRDVGAVFAAILRRDVLFCFLVGLFLRLLVVLVDVEERGKLFVGGRACGEFQLALLVIGNGLRHVVAHEIVVAGEVLELLCGHHVGLYGPGLVALLALHLRRRHVALRTAVTLGRGKHHLELCQFLDGLVVVQFGVVVAAIVHERHHIGRYLAGDVLLGEGDQCILDVATRDGDGLVFQVAEILVADGDATSIGIAGLQRDFGRAEVGTHLFRLSIGSTLVAVEQRKIAVDEYLYVGRMAVGEHLVLTHGLVVTNIIQRVVVAYQVALFIDAVNVHTGFAHRLSPLVEQFDIERVVLLEETRTQPVEVHQLAIFMLGQVELG